MEIVTFNMYSRSIPDLVIAEVKAPRSEAVKTMRRCNEMGINFVITDVVHSAPHTACVG